MPDIREVLAALDQEDKRMWLQHRTQMRRSYLTAHHAVLGAEAWDNNDDAFLDMIDIKLAILFDRAGRMNTAKVIVDHADSSETEGKLLSEDDALKAKKAVENALGDINGNGDKDKIEKSEATKSMQTAWPSIGNGNGK